MTAAQAAERGIEAKRLADLVASGDLRRVRHGVYAMRGIHHRLELEVAAWLAIDPKRLSWDQRGAPVAVLSHGSAAALHGLGAIIPGLPELTVTKRPTVRGAAMRLHVAPLSVDDWQQLRIEDGLSLPVTAPARTIVDLALAREEPTYIRRAIAEALHGALLDRSGLVSTAARRKGPSRSIVARISKLYDEATA